MPKKKRTSTGNRQNSLRIRDISDVSGNLNIAGGDITTYNTVTGLSGAEIQQLFEGLYTKIENRPNTPAADKEDLKVDVKDIEAAVSQAVQNNEKVDESFLSRRFRNLARMAPDILDVVVASLANPLAGLGVAVKKIAEKAKEDTKN